MSLDHFVAGNRPRRIRLTALCLACLISTAPQVVRADVVGEGDVGPGMLDQGFWGISLPIDGGDVDDDIVVGGTGIPETGTTVGILSIDTPAFTDPLTSNNAYIGGASETVGFDGIGEATITGFGSEWSIDQLLVVGQSGVGYLNILSGSLVRSNYGSAITNDPDSIVGRYMGSQGYVTLSGFGSRWLNDNLVVGDLGYGRVEVLARARLETRDEAIIGNEAQSFPGAGELGIGYVLLDGRGTRWNIGNVNPNAPSSSGAGDLTVGREGRGVLEIRNQALVMVEEDTRIGSLVAGGTQSFGQVYVSGQESMLWNLERLFVGSATSVAAGELHLENQGVARADTSTAVSARGLVRFAGGTLLTPTVTNAGVMRGYGRIEAAVVNNGMIRNAASTANLREYLKITGPVTNNADIESIGGEMEFESLVSNVGPDGDIVGIDAVLRFNAGLANSGNVYLDNTVVWTPGTFSSTAALVVEASTSTILGSMSLSGTNSLFVELGSEYSRLEVSHAAALGGALQLSLGDAYIPRAGDAFEIIEAQSVTGTFSSVVAPVISGLNFDVTYLPQSVVVNISAGFQFNADWDGDGTVTGLDLAIWSSNFGSMVTPGTLGDANGDGKVDGADFAIWQQQLGTMPVTPAAGAVPEPATTALGLACLAVLPRRRRRRA